MAESALWLALIIGGASAAGAGIGWLLARLQYPPVKPKHLDCGCPSDGRPEYGCRTCDFTRCLEHVDVPHRCVECPECRRALRSSAPMWNVEMHARWHAATGAAAPLY